MTTNMAVVASRDRIAEAVHMGRFPAVREPTPLGDEDPGAREYCYRIADKVRLCLEGQGAVAQALLPTCDADYWVLEAPNGSYGFNRTEAACRADAEIVAGAVVRPLVYAASPLNGHARHLTEVDFPNGMRLTIVREDEYDAVTIWSEDGESIFTQAGVAHQAPVSPAEQVEPDWIEWAGGENPVPGQTVEVKIRWRNGEPSEGASASDDMEWTHRRDGYGEGGDIIAYRFPPLLLTGGREDEDPH